MPLAGRTLLPREVANIGAPHWRNAELVKMVATTLGESNGSIGAWHDNVNTNGTVTSRDCGLMQINISATEIGTTLESSLRTESLRPNEYMEVADANVAAAYRLYEQPWTGRTARCWQPWVAYTTGWATFPEFWVWHQENGKSIGPWRPTGRYVQRAIAGVANYHLWIRKDMTTSQALDLAASYMGHFGVRAQLKLQRGFVALVSPPAPVAPPEDGVGPRPLVNDGR